MDWRVLQLWKDLDDAEEERLEADLERGGNLDGRYGKENRDENLSAEISIGKERLGCRASSEIVSNDHFVEGASNGHVEGLARREHDSTGEKDGHRVETPSKHGSLDPVRRDMEIMSEVESRRSSIASHRTSTPGRFTPSHDPTHPMPSGSETQDKRDSNAEERFLSCRNKGIRLFSGVIRGFSRGYLDTVVSLDVSGNAIVSLHELAEALPQLKTLNISNNKIYSLQLLITDLRKCHELRHIEMVKCGKWAKDPYSYSADVFRELPAIETVDKLSNPRPLSEKQHQVARFLHRLFKIGPNELASLNLDKQDIAGEEFPIILRSLSHLKPIRLWIKENPASNIRSYRLQVIHLVGDSLMELDGKPVTFNEKANARSAMKELKQQLEEYNLQMYKKGFQNKHFAEASELLQESLSPLGHSRMNGQSPNSWIAGSNSSGHGHSCKQHKHTSASEHRSMHEAQSHTPDTVVPELYQFRPRRLDFDGCESMEGDSEIQPLDAHNQVVVSPLQRQIGVRFNLDESVDRLPSSGEADFYSPAGKVTSHDLDTFRAPMKVSIMTVASRGLCEDLEDFVTMGDGTVVLENASDPNWYTKLWSTPLEVITGRVMAKVEQVFNYFQFYLLIYLLNVDWPNFWQSFNTSWKFSEILVNILPSLNFTSATSGMALAVSQTLFVLTLLVPAGLYWLYRANSLMCCVLSPLSCWVTTIARVENFLRKKIGYTLRQLRGRICLFLMTIVYLPLSRTCLYTLEPVTDMDTGELVIRQFPKIAWPTVNGFNFSDHWVMILAGAGVLLYVIGIPLFFLRLVLHGTKEAEQAYDLPHMDEEISHLRAQHAASTDEEERASLHGMLTARETAKRLLYAKAVRRYVNAQAYVYQDYKQSSKAYKVFVMGQKIAILILVLYLREPVVHGNRASIAQSFLVFAISMAAVLVSALRKPYEASSENMIETVFWSANVFNAFVALLLASTTKDNPEESSSVLRSDAMGVILLVVNALAFCIAVGVVGATPRLHSLAKEQDQHMKEFIFEMRSERARAEAECQATPVPGADHSDPPSNVVRRAIRAPPPPPTTTTTTPSMRPRPIRPAPSPPRSDGSFRSISLGS